MAWSAYRRDADEGRDAVRMLQLFARVPAESLARYCRMYGHSLTLLGLAFESALDCRSGRDQNSIAARTCGYDDAKVMQMPYCSNCLSRLHAFPKVGAVSHHERLDLIVVRCIRLNLAEGLTLSPTNGRAG